MNALEPLTNREQQVLDLIGKGKTSKENPNGILIPSVGQGLDRDEFLSLITSRSNGV